MFGLLPQSLGQKKGYDDDINELQCSSGVIGDGNGGNGSVSKLTKLSSTSFSLSPLHLLPLSWSIKQWNISKSALLSRHVAGGHERLGKTHCSSLSSVALSL